MTTVGSGSSGSFGGSQVPYQRELEASAWTEVNKAALGITSDNLETVMTQINPRYVSGYLGGFGYKSSSGQPLLNSPLENARSALSPLSSGSRNWKETYEELQDSLPDDVKKTLIAQQQLPVTARSTSIIALDNTLNLMAKFLVNVRQAAEPPVAGSVQAERELNNLLLPVTTLKGALAQADEISQAGLKYLEESGANTPHFDGLLSTLNQLQTALNTTHRLSLTLYVSADGQLSSRASTLATHAQAQLSSLSSQIENVSLGNTLQLLKPTVDALNSAVTSLNLPYIGSAALFLSLNMAVLGNEQPSIAGSHLQSLIDTLSSQIANRSLESTISPGKLFFNHLVGTAFVALIGAASQLPKQDSSSDLDKFSSELLLTAMNSLGVLESYFHEAMAISGGDEETQQLSGSILGTASALLFSIASQNAKSSPSVTLVEDQREALLNATAAAEQLLQKAGATNDSAIGSQVVLNQMQRALQEKNDDAFLQLLSISLEQLGSPLETLKKDVSTLQQIVQTQVNNSSKNFNEPQTGIVNIA